MPDPIETLNAAKALVRERFTVLPYINADPVLAKRLEEVGCAAVMPLGAAIGSGQGIATRELIQIIIDEADVPVIIDAGLRSPADAAYAMEMGAHADLVNTAIAVSADPVAMAGAFKLAVRAGRQAALAGIMERRSGADPSSPLTSFLDND
jgi:thiazole synthase